MSDDTKRCSRCGETNPLTDFNRRGRKSNGEPRWQSWCRRCNVQYLRDHYAKNVDYYVDKARMFKVRNRAEVRRKLLEYFATHPCIDCGEADPVVLHFDHVRGVKLASVGQLVSGGYSWKWIAAEIEKCEVRCANCHMRRTAKQYGWHSYLT